MASGEALFSLCNGPPGTMREIANVIVITAMITMTP